ncbi:hypothetical protein IFM89_003941 [Coptis chinensis]|uniref:Uncharacterized protein n=1 Tax=Coptis chinensis TaxID=261450 RepID=A0A835H4B4_9MAGN|nr:hypothetical protein IFM89_003941 [Coptis chinensis]
MLSSKREQRKILGFGKLVIKNGLCFKSTAVKDETCNFFRVGAASSRRGEEMFEFGGIGAMARLRCSSRVPSDSWYQRCLLSSGHSEQVATSTNKEIDGRIPNYPNLPPQLICQLHNVTMHVSLML